MHKGVVCARKCICFVPGREEGQSAPEEEAARGTAVLFPEALETGRAFGCWNADGGEACMRRGEICVA